jgi:uncharacterized protein YbjQ (UPF0145 family)
MTSAERYKEYENLFKQSQSYNPAQFQQDFEKSYGEATNYNKDLIESRNQAISQAQSLPSKLREQYYSSPIRNPLAQESLIAQQRGAITSDIANKSDLLDARGARYQDILGKQLGMYQTSAEQARTAAENAWRMYQDVLAQEEAERARAEARAAAAAQAAALEEFYRSQNEVNDWIEVPDETPKPPPPPKIARPKSWTTELMDSDRNWGVDLSTVDPRKLNSSQRFQMAALGGLGPLNPTVWKTIGGAVGNLAGNWRNKDMTFLEKLYNQRF